MGNAWYFAICCAGYVPIACDFAMKVIINEKINFWFVSALSLLVCVLMCLMAYNTKVVLAYYPNGVGAFSLAKDNLNKYFAVIAGAGALVDYLLTAVIMATYFAYSLEGVIGDQELKYSVLISSCVLVLAALLSFRKIKINLTIIKIISTVFFIMIFGVILLVSFQQMGKGLIFAHFSFDFKSLTEKNQIYLGLVAIFKCFSYLTICVLGFDNNRLINLGYKKTTKGIYITVFLVSVFLCSVLYLAQNLSMDFATNKNVISQIIEQTTIFRIFSVINLLFLAVVMFLCTSASFALLPAFAEILAKEKYFPTLFKNNKDDFMYLNGVLLTLFFSLGVVFLSKGKLENLLEIYCIGAFLAMGIGQLAMWRKIEKGKAKVMAFLGMFVSFAIMLMFCFFKFDRGAWIIISIIAILSVFMLDVKKYYTKVDKALTFDKNERIIMNNRNISIVIITDMNKGIVPAVKYAQAISPDSRAIYVAENDVDEKKLLEDWEYYFEQIPLIVLKNDKKHNVLKPVMKYIDYTRKGLASGTITVVIPEFIPSSPFFMFFHRNYAFILRIILGFKKGIVLTSVPYRLN